MPKMLRFRSRSNANYLVAHLFITHLVRYTHKRDIFDDIGITFTFLLGGIHEVRHNINPCHPSYPIMYKSFVMEAQADVIRCCTIVIFLDQLSLEERGCNR